MSEAEYSGEPTTQGNPRQHENPIVQEVFSMFKSYLEDKIDEKSKQLGQKGKTEKEVVQLNYKGKQKQYEMNGNIEGIIDDISRENDRDSKNPQITALVDKAKAAIHRRQKLIKVADRSKEGWNVVEEYESDDFASDSEDEKRNKKAKEVASRKRRLSENAHGKERLEKLRMRSEPEQRLFCGKINQS